MYKKLKAISIHHLGKEFKKIWNEIVEIKQSIAQIKDSLNIVDVNEVQGGEIDKPIQVDIPEVAQEQDNAQEESNTHEETQELTELEKAKLKAEALGVKVHHKAKLESILKAIEDKENA